MSAQPRASSFRHEALLYASWPEFVAGTLPFIRQGLDLDEVILVVVSLDKIDLLRTALDRDADRVMFANMSEVGSNPARIIPAWVDFVHQHAGRTSGLRGIGEPIWSGRSSDELTECQHHESLLNIAFDSGPAWQLLCPYDVAKLDPDVIAEARCSHQYLKHRAVTNQSVDFRGVDACAAPNANPLPEPRTVVLESSIDRASLPTVRAQLARHAAAAGLSPTGSGRFVTAVNEIATNSVLHGGGSGRLRIWKDTGKIICEVRDHGLITDPLVDRRKPGPDPGDSRGLWLANQFCDLVQIRSIAGETVIRLHMRLDSRPRLSVFSRLQTTETEILN